MAYTTSGRFPIERASKLGHIKIIQEPRIQRLLEEFERTDAPDPTSFGELSGSINLDDPGDLENIVAIDGSHACIPNVLATHKRLAFLTSSAIYLTRNEVGQMRENPIVDPRTIASRLERNISSLVAALPLGGISIPGETVVETLRRTIDDVLRYTGLYDTLRFLVSREWLPSYSMGEHMECVSCGREFLLPRSALSFGCPHCSHRHSLSDYLQLVSAPPEDWAKEEVAIGLRNIMETLHLFSFLVLYRNRPLVLRRTLFLKDGPLLLRAQLSRLIEPIRDFIGHLKENGNEVHLIGIEKTGDFVDHTALIRDVLVHQGDYFLPTVRYLHERIQGTPFIEASYRNRVQYGNKVMVRLGRDHLIAANVPTGEFKTAPSADDLFGFQHSMALLSGMVSYSYENALIPLVLANRAASISIRPSGDILEAFARRTLGD